MEEQVVGEGEGEGEEAAGLHGRRVACCPIVALSW